MSGGPDQETVLDLYTAAERTTRRLLDDDRAATVAAEAVARALARWDKAAAAPHPFVTRNAIALVVDELERDARAPGADFAAGPEVRPQAPGDVPARRVVALALPLPRRQREILVATCSLGYSPAEVSRILGISLPTVKLELRDALSAGPATPLSGLLPSSGLHDRSMARPALPGRAPALIPHIEVRARALRRRRRALLGALATAAVVGVGVAVTALAAATNQPVSVENPPRIPAGGTVNRSAGGGGGLAATATTTSSASLRAGAGTPSTVPSITIPLVAPGTLGGNPPGSVPGAPGLGSVGPSLCSVSAGLAVTAGEQQVSGGHQGYPVVFTNEAGASCVIVGFAQVVALTPSGAVAQTAELSPAGPLGGLATSVSIPPIVTLAPGQSASVLVEGTMGASCPAFPALSVTAPDDDSSRRVTLPTPLQGCGQIQTHPVVAGTTGSD